MTPLFTSEKNLKSVSFLALIIIIVVLNFFVMPIRTCLVTKSKAHQSDLLRFTIQDRVLVFDQDKKTQKRGGYVIPQPEAIRKLSKLSSKIAYFLKEPQVEISKKKKKKEILRRSKRS